LLIWLLRRGSRRIIAPPLRATRSPAPPAALPPVPPTPAVRGQYRQHRVRPARLRRAGGCTPFFLYKSEPFAIWQHAAAELVLVLAQVRRRQRGDWHHSRQVPLPLRHCIWGQAQL
jgi:hypothetical protein